ncbi:MAG: hypothetical protein AAF849_11430 [Bacteroidota bacterium]
MITGKSAERLDWRLDKSSVFLTEWGVFEYDKLPKDYFNFQNRKETCKMMTKKELTKLDFSH